MIKKSKQSYKNLAGDIITGSSLKELYPPFLVFVLVFSLYMILLKFHTTAGMLIFFLALLIIFIKKTEFLFYMAIISLPFLYRPWSFDFVFHIKINHVLFLLTAISFFYNKFRDKDYSFTITYIDAPIFVFLLVSAISVFQTSHIGNTPLILYDALRNYPWIKGLFDIIMLSFMLVAYYITANIVTDKKIFKKTLMIMITTAIVISLYGLFGCLYTLITSTHLPHSIDPLMDIERFQLRIRSTFDEPLYLGNYLISILPVLYCLIMQKKAYFNKYFMIAASVILTITLILTFSMGALLGYAVFLFLFIIIYRKIIFSSIFKRFLKSVFIMCLIFTFLVLLNPVVPKMNIDKEGHIALLYNSYRLDEILIEKSGIFKPVFGWIVDYTVGVVIPSNERFWSMRTRLWSFKHAWDGFVQHPLLGVGYGNYMFYSGLRVYPGLVQGAINFPEVNNFPLKILTETGLIGLIVIIWIVVKILKGAVYRIANERDETKKTFIIGYIFSFIAVSVQMMFFSYINLAYLWVMLAMMMGLYGAKTIDIKRTDDSK